MKYLEGVDFKVEERIALAFFIGYSFLTGVVMTISPRAAGSFMGLVSLSGVAVISIAVKDVDETYRQVFGALATASLVVTVLATAYLGTLLAIG